MAHDQVYSISLHVLQEFVWHMIKYTVCFSYKGILYLKCQLNTCYTAVVEYYFNSGHQERVPNHSSQTACFDLFKLTTPHVLEPRYIVTCDIRRTLM